MNYLTPIDSDRDDFEVHFKVAGKYLNRALKHDDTRYVLEDFYKGCKAKSMMLWIFYNEQEVVGAMVTQLLQYSKKRVLIVKALSAEKFVDMMEYWEKFKVWARENKADVIEIWGRFGWEKVLTKYGFEKCGTMMQMSL